MKMGFCVIDNNALHKYLFCPQDEYPLASLPLLGYSISLANQSDGIDKNFVFKLTFKSHAYFFRAESQCTFERLELFEKLFAVLCNNQL